MFKLKPEITKVEYKSGMYFPCVEFQTLFDPDGAKWCVRISWTKSEVKKFLLWEWEVVEYAVQVVGEEKEVPRYIVCDGHKLEFGKCLGFVPYYFDTEADANAYIEKLRGINTPKAKDYNEEIVKTAAAIDEALGIRRRRRRGQKIVGDTC